MSYNPYSIVDEFEKRISEWCGAPYGVAVESCTAAIFLSLQYCKQINGSIGAIEIPKFTYPSVPASIIHCGGKVVFTDNEWYGNYELRPLSIWDAALRFKKDMYHGGFQCLSFHVKKHLKIGRGGMILTDNKEAYDWLRLARFDGREPVPLLEQKEFNVLGWNMYMEPTQASRGIQLFEVLRAKHPDGMPDLPVDEQGYSDLSKFPIFRQ